MNTSTETGGTTAIQEKQRVMQSLEAGLPQAEGQERAFLLYQLGSTALQTGDVEPRAIGAFSGLRDLAVVLGDARLEALAYNGLSAAHDAIGLRHESLREAIEAERLATAAGDQFVRALALNNQAQYYKETGENRTAFRLFKEIQDIGYATHDDRLVMAGYIGLGRTTSMAEADLAISYYEQALALGRSLGDTEGIATCLNNLADWMINTGRYAESITMREESERLSREIGDREGIGRSFIGRAKAHTLLGDYQQAWAFLNTGLPIVLRARDFEGELHSYLNLAHLYVRQGDIPRACDYYQQALDKSLGAPDHACAVFARRALDELAEGILPRPAILPPVPVTPETIRTNPVLNYTYPTGDKKWGGFAWAYLN